MTTRAVMSLPRARYATKDAAFAGTTGPTYIQAFAEHYCDTDGLRLLKGGYLLRCRTPSGGSGVSTWSLAKWERVGDMQMRTWWSMPEILAQLHLVLPDAQGQRPLDFAGHVFAGYSVVRYSKQKETSMVTWDVCQFRRNDYYAVGSANADNTSIGTDGTDDTAVRTKLAEYLWHYNRAAYDVIESTRSGGMSAAHTITVPESELERFETLIADDHCSEEEQDDE